MIITRYHNTTTLQLTVEFLTPTFLGGADQHAELRAAPFKNLLRQWWRVAVGSQFEKDEKMLQAEGDLFGSVLDDKQACASQVRLLLTPLDVKFSTDTKGLFFGKTKHPEVRNGMPVENALYLGFGPITYRDGAKQYITPGSTATLHLSFPKNQQKAMLSLLQYIDSFGTLGSRSRNGWGALSLQGVNFERKDIRSFKARDVSMLVDQETGKQFPTFLGNDNKGMLCWETKSMQTDWKGAMQSLAETYMTLRTNINIKPQGLKERHLLGYPVTHHPVPDWGGNNGRMPSQLRLMVKRNANDQLVGRVLHLPHCLPVDKPWDERRLGSQLDNWKKVHAQLDANNKFQRCGGAQ